MRDLRPLLGTLVVGAAACGPASFPDQSAVVAAQGAYCQALAKMNGADAGWEHLGACKGASPSASPAYLRGMTKCLPARKESSKDAVDMGLLVAACKDEVLLKLSIDEATAQEAMAARCDRAARCEKASVPECIAAAKKIDPTQRATLYGMYNGAAIHEISDCLKSTTCAGDEYAAQQACYKSADERLLWSP